MIGNGVEPGGKGFASFGLAGLDLRLIMSTSDSGRLRVMSNGPRLDTLLVIAPDRLSALHQKGEVPDGYYNPGDLFSEVHVLMINDDRPDPALVQPMVGTAKLTLHNLPADSGLLWRTLLWRPRLLRRWATAGIDLAAQIQPALVRCHGAHLGSFVASEIKRRLGVPFVISLHTNPDLDVRAHALAQAGGWMGIARNWRGLLPHWASIAIERASIQSADCIVCVYCFLVPYAERRGAKRIEVIHNVVCSGGIQPKTDYALGEPPTAVVPGRQLPGKDPTPVLEAMADIEDARLMLIGNGSLHEALRRRARELGIDGRTCFISSVPNRELCRTLGSYDVLVSVNDHGGVSKVELEAALVGMPVITNGHPLESKPEILGHNCVVVAGDAASYQTAIRKLLADQALRERLGTGLRESARHVAPEMMETAYVRLYRELASSATTASGARV